MCSQKIPEPTARRQIVELVMLTLLYGGTPMTGSRSRGRNDSYAYYHCRRGCEGVAVNKSVLEDQFLELLSKLEPRREYLRLFRAVVLDSWRSERKTRQRSVLVVGRSRH
jgi:hypothetical protein